MPTSSFRITLSLAALSCILAAASASYAAEKIAICVVMPWYGDADNWYNWAHAGHDPAQISDGKRHIAAAHYPLMGPYKSRDDRTEAWHLAFAESMGMDVLLVDYYTQNLGGKSAYYDFTVNLLEKATGGNLKVAVQYEPKIHTQNWVRNYNDDRAAITNAVKDDLRHIHDVLAAKPAYWRVDNKPVVQIFGQTWTLKAAEWADVVTTLNNEGRELYYIGDAVPGGVQLAGWFPQFQAHLNWSLYYSSIAGMQGRDANYNFTRAVNEGPSKWAKSAVGRQAVGVAWPGFDDSGVDGWGNTPRKVDRADGAFYRASLDAMNDLNHDWRVFATLNDWNEGTELEPSHEYGYQYAIDTQNHIEAWKGKTIDDELPQDVTEQHFPSLVSLWDHADQLDASQQHEAVKIDRDNKGDFADDSARYTRDSSMPKSYLQYELAEGVRGFRVSAWYLADIEVKDLKFFTSPDGNDWTEHKPVIVNKGGKNWIKHFYKNNADLPDGHTYLRIQWPISSGPWSSPQIGEIKAY